MRGGCQCGAARYAATIRDPAGYLCHCTMCRRATGGVSIAFTNVAQADLQWESGPDWYRSSPIAERPFCARCGTPLGFRYLDSDRIDLTIGSFDEPQFFHPTQHFAMESALHAWLDTSALPGKRSDEHQPLVDRWMNAVGKLPD